MFARLVREWRVRNAGQFLHWLAARVVRRRSHLIFTLDVSAVSSAPVSSDVRIVEIRSRNFAAVDALRSSITKINAENGAYLYDVQKGNSIAVVLLREDRIAHYAFVFLRNKTSSVLGLPVGTALIGNAFTIPSYRGRGLQAESVRCRAHIAREAGFGSIACEISPGNIASQRGLEKAGMQLRGRLELVVVMNCVVVRWRRPPGFRLLDICL